MTNEFKNFGSAEFGSVRATEISGKPYFVGEDGAKALGYNNPKKALNDHVEGSDRITPEGEQTVLINESGLYDLIIGSRLDNAKDFKRWVTATVLPALKKKEEKAPVDNSTNDDTVLPTRELTPEEYFAAAKLIASCNKDRLKLVLNLLSRGGWYIDGEVKTQTIGADTSDIGPRLLAFRTEHSLTRVALSAKLGISTEVIRGYEDGKRFPKPERYKAILLKLDSLTFDDAVK